MAEAQPAKAADVYRLLNDHLTDVSEPQKRLKKSSDHCEWAEKPRDCGQDTASSHHEEEASLGKRSASDTSDLRLTGRRKDVCHFLDSISVLEGVIAHLESSELVAPDLPTSAPEVRHPHPADPSGQTTDSLRLG